MLADIIPTKKMPKNLKQLTYQVPSKLKNQLVIGQLVEIPLRSSINSGIILKFYHQKTLPYKLKNILQPISAQAIFNLQQLNLFKLLANYYYVSLSLFIHYNLPKMLKKEQKQLVIKSATKNYNSQIKKIVWWQDKKSRTNFYLQQIKKNKLTQSQLLIVVPRIRDIYLLAEQLKLKNNNYLAIHSQLKRQKFLKAYQQVNQKKELIIIGTKRAFFLPFTKLRTIIIDEIESPWHKQSDMNPRYHAKIIVNFMQKIYGSQIFFSSYAPSLTDYYKLKPISPTLPRQKNIEIINNHYLIRNKNYTFISDKLLNALKDNIRHKKSSFLLINKKGEASSISCNDCGYTFTCPHCQLPLIKTNQNQLICYYCNHVEDLPPFCPVCQGAKFKNIGLGIQKIEKKLQQLLPKSTKILRIDKEKRGVQLINQKIPSIYLGTQYALDKIPWPQVNLIAMINVDQLYQHIEYNSLMSAYQMLIKLLTLSNKNAKIIFQTFKPQHYLIQSLRKHQPEIFYQTELNLRRKFVYPPFCTLIKLSYLHNSPKIAQQTAQQLKQKLQQLSPKLIINGPLPILRQKIRNKYKFNLIIKVKKIKTFKNLNSAIPNDWLIDIQPQNLLD